MGAGFRSHLLASFTGGLVVAGSLVALGVAGRSQTRTIFEQGPMQAQSVAGRTLGLTPHDIYVRDAPGVVFVKALIVQQVQDPFDLFPQREQSTSTGSGFLVSGRGFILTNYHVIQGADRQSGVTVQFEDNVSRRAVVVGEDQSDDLALLKVDIAGVPSVQPLALGDSESVRVGDPTLAIGNPFGLDRTLTSGIVSALQRQIQAPNGFSIDNVIQTDAPINPGNSGGPLLDAAGRVIGINSQIATGGDSGTGAVGIGFAVPINTAKAKLSQLERGGPITFAYLGVSAGEGAPVTESGVSIEVQRGGPAADAGLRNHDTIQQINGQKVEAIAQLLELVAARQPGAAVSVRFRRGRQERTARVVLGARPAVAPG